MEHRRRVAGRRCHHHRCRLAAPPPAAHARRDNSMSLRQHRADANASNYLLVNGTQNIVTALGTRGDRDGLNQSLSPTRSSTITVYGWDETVFFRNGDPFIWDCGRELEW